MNSFELWKNEDMGMPEALINTDSYTDALEKVLHNLGYYIKEQKKPVISFDELLLVRSEIDKDQIHSS